MLFLFVCARLNFWWLLSDFFAHFRFLYKCKILLHFLCINYSALISRDAFSEKRLFFYWTKKGKVIKFFFFHLYSELKSKYRFGKILGSENLEDFQNKLKYIGIFINQCFVVDAHKNIVKCIWLKFSCKNK